MQVNEQVGRIFKIPHLQYVWPRLRALGLDTKVIAKAFWNEYSLLGNKTSESIYFLEWGETVLQPWMNLVLHKDLHAPTFVEMMEDIMEPFVEKNRAAIDPAH